MCDGLADVDCRMMWTSHALRGECVRPRGARVDAHLLPLARARRLRLEPIKVLLGAERAHALLKLGVEGGEGALRWARTDGVSGEGL